MSLKDELTKPWNHSASAYADVFDGSITQLIQPTLDAAAVSAHCRVLDVATGPGIIAAAASARGAIATGVDFAENMVSVARRRYPTIDFQVADATKLPFADDSFDAVVMGLALFMILEPDKALKEAHRVLTAGGKFACSVWDWPVPGFDLFYSSMEKYAPEEPMLGGQPPLFGVSDPEVLESALVNAGFVDAVVETLPIEWEMDSAEELFDALATLRDFSVLSDEELNEFRAEVVSAAGEYKAGVRYRIPFPALIVSGRKA